MYSGSLVLQRRVVAEAVILPMQVVHQISLVQVIN